ncbi:MAG: primosomal protein N' [Candidatus Gastranaerophilales bacterium]|nr:primosomal protein N' [Candidatus Gastranaerophilales bacterium]
MTPKYAQVLVDINKLGTKTFSYLIPESLKDDIKVGVAVAIPFGNRKEPLKAYVVGFSNYLEAGIKAKEITEILDSEPLFSLEYLQLLEWVASYYFCDIQTVLNTALPQKFFEKNVKKYRTPKIKSKLFDVEKISLDKELSPLQQKVLDEIRHVDSKTSLLYGITGSGKTEIYFKLIEDTIKKGKNVIFLAPEIALVSQLTMRTIEHFGSEVVAIWHSSITEAEKYETWKKLRSNEIKILFGARSAVFAPIKDLGLIIIDEEHDSSYKQTMPNPRYNAKDVAKKLCELYGAKLVLGSATPSIESYYEAINTNSLFKLKERFNNAKLPKVVLIDMKVERAERNYTLFSKTLQKNVKETIERGEQVIFLINRRGFSSYTQCMECGEVVNCKKCAIPMIYHSQTNSYKCHYCNSTVVEPKCEKCGSSALEHFGVGSQKVETVARAFFPDYRIERLDSDSLTKKNEHIEILKRFQNKEIDILIGTQMIAKGLDNKNVTLVGVINADLSFNLPDYRSSERGFSILTQVAGRSGRGENEGKVIFQTYNSNNLYLQNAQEQNFENFYENEIELREMLDYPPFSKMIRIVLSSKNEYRAEKSALEIELALSDYIKKLSLDETLLVLGPTPCVINKIKDEYRFNIIVKNKLGENGHKTILRFLRSIKLPSDIKMIVDIDPADIL